MTRRGGYLGGHTLMPESWKGHSDDDLRLIREGRKEARARARKAVDKQKQGTRELIALNGPENPRRLKRIAKVPAKGD